jgi:hypothetical protein
MNIVSNNPFRILDLPITASERQIERQINSLAAFAAMGKAKPFDTDFPFLPIVERSSDVIEEAKKQIERSEGKFLSSLFWFWRKNDADESALGALRNGDIGRGIQILEEYISNKNVTENNFSSVKNLSILYLCRASINQLFNEDYFNEGLRLAGKLFTSTEMPKYSSLIAGDKYVYKPDEAFNYFFNNITQSVRPYLGVYRGISILSFTQAFSNFSDEAKQYVLSRFITKPLQDIENEIEVAYTKRTNVGLTGDEAGPELIKKTESTLLFLREILGISDWQYQFIADKLSIEIVQCAIAYFNKTDDDKSTLPLYIYALEIAIGEIAKRKAKQNLDSCKEWIANNESLPPKMADAKSIIDRF